MQSPYGNAASVFTESGGVARHVMERASAGMVGVNVGVPVPREPFSFGGWNESKFGVGDITGRGSIEFWTQSKKMTTKWNREAGTNWMSSWKAGSWRSDRQRSAITSQCQSSSRIGECDRVTFTGIQFENPFLLSSAPPTESESNILRAFEAGWGGVVTKTIGLHPVVNVVGAKAKFMRTSPDDSVRLDEEAARCGAALVVELGADLRQGARLVGAAHPPHQGSVSRTRVLIASIMAGSGNDKELRNWQTLAEACQDAGADGSSCNFSCPHMDRKDMGSNIGKDEGLCSVVTEAVKEVAKVPVWTKLTPATQDIVVEAAACFRGGADAIVSSNTFPSLPIIDPETLEFEINVDGLVSSGGLGWSGDSADVVMQHGADVPGVPGSRRSRALVACRTSRQALSYFLLGAGTVQVCTAAMLDQAVGPNVIKRLLAGFDAVPRAGMRRRVEIARGFPRRSSRSHGAAVADPPARRVTNIRAGTRASKGYASPAQREARSEDPVR